MSYFEDDIRQRTMSQFIVRLDHESGLWDVVDTATELVISSWESFEDATDTADALNG